MLRHQEKKLQLILIGENTVQKRYQVSLEYIIELSYNNSNYDIIEFENVEDYETCRVTKYTRILKTGEDMIKMNTSGMIFFSKTKDGAWDNRVKISVMTIGDWIFYIGADNFSYEYTWYSHYLRDI